MGSVQFPSKPVSAKPTASASTKIVSAIDYPKFDDGEIGIGEFHNDKQLAWELKKGGYKKAKPLKVYLKDGSEALVFINKNGKIEVVPAVVADFRFLAPGDKLCVNPDASHYVAAKSRAQGERELFELARSESNQIEENWIYVKGKKDGKLVELWYEWGGR